MTHAGQAGVDAVTAQRSSAMTDGQEGSGWTGWIVFAGIMMILVGSFSAIQGLVALFKSDYYLVGSSDLVVNVNFKTWGWVHLVFGIIIALATTLTLLPALLTVLKPPPEQKPIGYASLAPMDRFLEKRRNWVVGTTLAATILGLPLLAGLTR